MILHFQKQQKIGKFCKVCKVYYMIFVDAYCEIVLQILSLNHITN